MSMRVPLLQTLSFGRYLLPRQYRSCRTITPSFLSSSSPSATGDSPRLFHHHSPLTSTTTKQQETAASAMSSSSSAPVSGEEPNPSQTQTQTQASNEAQSSSSTTAPLPLPEPTATPTHPAAATQLTVDGAGVKLDHLGPLVVNVDGSMSRIANWDRMADIERENTLRIIGKRNQARLAKLRGAAGAETAKQEGEGDGEGEGEGEGEGRQ